MYPNRNSSSDFGLGRRRLRFSSWELRQQYWARKISRRSKHWLHKKIFRRRSLVKFRGTYFLCSEIKNPLQPHCTCCRTIVPLPEFFPLSCSLKFRKMASVNVTAKFRCYDRLTKEHVVDVAFTLTKNGGYALDHQIVEAEMVRAFPTVIRKTMTCYTEGEAAPLPPANVMAWSELNRRKAAIERDLRHAVETGVGRGSGQGLDGGVELIDAMLDGMIVGYVKHKVNGLEATELLGSRAIIDAVLLREEILKANSYKIALTFHISCSNLTDHKVIELIGNCGVRLISGMVKVLVQAGVLPPVEPEDLLDDALVEHTITSAAMMLYNVKFPYAGSTMQSIPQAERTAVVKALRDELYLGAHLP